MPRLIAWTIVGAFFGCVAFALCMWGGVFVAHVRRRQVARRRDSLPSLRVVGEQARVVPLPPAPATDPSEFARLRAEMRSRNAHPSSKAPRGLADLRGYDPDAA